MARKHEAMDDRTDGENAVNPEATISHALRELGAINYR